MKIICVGLNYGEHIREMGGSPPSEPLFFLKADSSLLKGGKPLFLPSFSDSVEYEAELVYRICRVGKSIPARFAYRYYDAVTVGIDVTARDIQKRQMERGLPWEISKSFDFAAPIGDFIPTEELCETGGIGFRLEKNGVVVQRGSSAEMIFGVDSLISYLSQFFTLKIGDMIFTGTPSGVGPMRCNDHFTGYIGERKVLDLHIR